MKRVVIITVSDNCHRGVQRDESGPALADTLAQAGWVAEHAATVPDDIASIRNEFCCVSRRMNPDLLVSTGGTGISPRDVTPEAVRPLLDKELPGLAELMRLKGFPETPRAALSRSLAGVMGKTLVLCLPGSPRGAVQSIQAVLEVLPHAVDLVKGHTGH